MSKHTAEEHFLYENWLSAATGEGVPRVVQARVSHLLFYLEELRRVADTADNVLDILQCKAEEEKILAEFVRILDSGLPDTFTEHQPDEDSPF